MHLNLTVSRRHIWKVKLLESLRVFGVYFSPGNRRAFFGDLTRSSPVYASSKGPADFFSRLTSRVRQEYDIRIRPWAAVPTETLRSCGWWETRILSSKAHGNKSFPFLISCWMILVHLRLVFVSERLSLNYATGASAYIPSASHFGANSTAIALVGLIRCLPSNW